MEPWALLPVVEPAFPADGFAHSAGLATARRLGQVQGPDDLAAFVEEALWAAGSFGVPFVRAARANPRAHAAVDARCDAATRGRAVNLASRAQGQAFLSAAAELSPATSGLAAEARRLGLPAHLAPAFGAVLGLLGARDDDASRLFLFLGARGLLSAATRLGLVGAPAAQALLARVAPEMVAVLLACRAADGAEAAVDAHAGDLLQSHQDRLYWRLYSSGAGAPARA